MGGGWRRRPIGVERATLAPSLSSPAGGKRAQTRTSAATHSSTRAPLSLEGKILDRPAASIGEKERKEKRRIVSFVSANNNPVREMEGKEERGGRRNLRLPIGRVERTLACRDGVAHVRALHRSGEKRACVAANGRCAPTARRSSARASPLTQGSPLCGSRMCPWLRCVDLLAVAACSTPRFHSERAKSPAWTFLPPSPPRSHPLVRRPTLHSLADPRPPSPHGSSDSYFRRSLDGNAWKPRGNLTFRAVPPRQTVAFPRRITNHPLLRMHTRPNLSLRLDHGTVEIVRAFPIAFSGNE